jgi:hypothetical protein
VPKISRYPQSVIDAYCADRLLGMTAPDAQAKYGISHNTGDNWWARFNRNGYARNGPDGMPPRSPGQIRAHTAARKAFNDFAYFRLACFGATTTPAQAKTADELRDAIESGRREFVCLNVMPGFGKTLMLQHLLLWLIARNRSIRCMWGAASDEIAELRTRYIRAELMRTEPGEGNAEDIASGRAVKPKWCMAWLFGRFRPSSSHGLRWAAGELTVASARPDGKGEGPPPDGPTLLAVGPRTRQLGKRANFIVWDDVWTRDENENVERGNKIKRFYDHTATTRLQENGTMVLVMQRLGPGDLSRHVLDKRRPILDPEGAEVGFESVYRHIVYPAHHDELCNGKHPPGMRPWDPDRPKVGECLTDPLALPPQDFVTVRATSVYLVEYQQRDVDPVGATFREIWLTGGTDEDRQTYRGCLDPARGLWELPDGVPTSTLASAVAIDVGHEGYWGLVASVHSTEKDSEMEWILAADHRRMPAGTDQGLLDYDWDRREFVGMLEDWWQMSKSVGVPFTHVVAEYNCAQRHLFQRTNVINRWQMTRNCRVVAHTTTKNKIDPKLGVEALLGIRLQLAAIRFPWRAGVTQNTMRALYNEILGYKQGYPTDDVLMALWMRSLNRNRISRPLAAVDPRPVKTTPAWVQGIAERRFAR